jgi:hypothetical protein
MKIDIAPFEAWENLNSNVAQELKVPTEIALRCSNGMASAVFELAQSTAQFYSHKRSIALMPGTTPHFQSVLPFLYKEGYDVQIAPENMPMKEWIETLKKDTCFVLLTEDHAITGELYDLDEAEKSLNDKRIFCIRASHNNHFYRDITILPYSARICSYDAQTACTLLGIRLKSPALISPFLDWKKEIFLQSVRTARAQAKENQSLVQSFEKKLPTGYSAFLQTEKRCFDRALIYTEQAGGEALQQFLASALQLQLERPGWETRLETTHLCRWGGTKNYDLWWKPRPAESILRGLLIFSTEILDHPDMRRFLEKALQECQIAEFN